MKSAPFRVFLTVAISITFFLTLTGIAPRADSRSGKSPGAHRTAPGAVAGTRMSEPTRLYQKPENETPELLEQIRRQHEAVNPVAWAIQTATGVPVEETEIAPGVFARMEGEKYDAFTVVWRLAPGVDTDAVKVYRSPAASRMRVSDPEIVGTNAIMSSGWLAPDNDGVSALPATGLKNKADGEWTEIRAEVIVPFTNFSVTNTNDSGTGSLRTALTSANADPNDPHVINITATGTINLLSVLPQINNISVSINGPGATSLTINRSSGGNYSIFATPNTLFSQAYGFSGMRMQNGAGSAGCMFIVGGSLTVSQCMIANNVASFAGGGLFIASSNPVQISNVTFTGNATASQGSAINSQGAVMTITNSTFSENQITGSNSGSGTVHHFVNATALAITNCTFSGNTSAQVFGQGVGLVGENSTTVRNTIFSGQSPQISGGGVSSLGNNICTDSSGPLNGTGDLPNTNPLLAALGSNGGQTQTCALLPGSPAINAGTATGAPITDQRGIARVGTTDIGSFESRGFTMTRGTGNSQTTAPGAAFGLPLTVTVASANGEPVNGGQVTFTPPGSGASATVAGNPATIASGSATSGTVTANATAGGPYNVAASVRGVTTGVNFSLTNACPTITAFSVTGGGSFCSGGTGVAVGLSDTETGVNYQLFRGASPVGSPVAGTGSAISFGNQTTAGTYTVVGTFGTTICTANMTGSAVVTVNPAPTAFNVTGGGSFCSGGTGVAVGLSGSQTGVNYQLFRGASPVGSPVAGTGSAISFGNQTTAGTYTVVATNGTTSCTSNMTGSATVTVNALPTAFNVTGGGSFCSGGAGVAVGLSGSQTGVNYQLFRGVSTVGSPVAGTGSAISFGNQSTAGTYTVVATATTGSCTANMTGSAVVTVNPTPTAFNVTGGGTVCAGGPGVAVGLSGSQTGVNYQLFRGASPVGSPVAGTGSAISFGNQSTAGTYTVVATATTGSCTANMTGSAVVTANSLVVTNGNDSGAGSLRDVLANACAGSTITFQTGVTTVTLTTAELSVGASVTINGGTGVTITRGAGSPNFRIFNILSGNTVAMNNLTVTNGNGTGDGGGILSNGALTLTSCTISGNAASNRGGGLFVLNASATLTGCTINGNTAANFGAAAFQNASATLTNCTVSGNTGSVGGLAFDNSSPATLTNCSVANNTSIGLVVVSSSRATSLVTLVNTMVLDTINGFVSLTSFNNLVQGIPGLGAAGGLVDGVDGNLVNVANPRVGVLGNYGGTTQTLALLPGSPAINAGTATGAPSTDQRGISRVGNVDIGAFESRGFTMALSGGNNQSAQIGTNFASPLAVTVSSAFGEPVDGGGVTFTPPGSGASANVAGTPATIASGTATTGTVTANGTVGGPYTVAASANGVTAGVNFSLTNACPTITAFSVTGGGSFCAGGSGVAVGLSGSQTGVNYQLFNGASPVGGPVAGTGSALSFGNQTTAGTYTVVGTFGATGCTANMTGSATVTVNALPTAFNVTGGGSFCAGGAGVAVGLSGSQTGVNYQLFNGASPVGSPVAGTGSAISFGNQTTAGTYTVVATATTGGCTSNMTGSAVVTVNPTPSIFNVTGGGSFCTGGTGVAVGLSGSQTGVNYQLFNGASPVGSPLPGTGAALNFGNQTTAGTYTVVATNGSTSCTSNMTGTAVVTVNALPSIFNVTGGGGTSCVGGTGVAVGLSGSQTGVNYQLFNGATPVGSPVAGTGSAISFGNQTTVGTYTVVATNTTTGCTSNMTGSATVTVNATPTTFNVTGGGSFCSGGTGVAVGLSGSQTGVNYQLFNGASPVGGPVAGTGSAISFGNQTTAGTYTVAATNTTTGCSASMTGNAVVTVNPTPSIFNVTGGGSFCSGGSGVAVGLNGSETGVNYQLFNGASPVGSPVAGTGSAISFGNQTTAGTYTVVATNGTTGCTSSMTSSAVVTVTICQPTVTTNPATGVSSSGATLNGLVTANGNDTSVLFRYGTTAGGPYPNVIAATPSPVTGTTPTAVSAVLTGLAADQIYYFVVEGSNVSGTSQGAEQSFSTATCSFSLSASSANFPASGGNGSVTLTTTTGCAWTVSGLPDWIINVSPANGTGTTAITYTVNPNLSQNARSATLTIGGLSYEVTQAPSVAVNSSIGLAITGQTVLPTSCAPNYANDYVITATLTNTGSQAIYNPHLRVLELQEAAGSAPPANPFRLLTADGATCGSGGLVGSIQSTDGQTTPATLPTLAPGQSVTVRLVIALPSLRRFRFIFGVDGSFVAPVAMKGRAAKVGFAKTFTLARHTEPSTGTAFVFIPNADGKTMNIIPVQPELEAFLNLGDNFWASLNQARLASRTQRP